MLTDWHADPPVVAISLLSLTAYGIAIRRYARLRGRAWPRNRTLCFVAGIVAAVLAIESPLDAAADARFAPHMVQHLLLTDGAAPLLLLGGPLLLMLCVMPPSLGRRTARALRSPVARRIGHPVITWLVFMVTLWLVHLTGFYQLALEHEPVHELEHAIFLGTALLFWLPIVAVGPTHWTGDQLAYPLRLLYVLLAMPAEALLGFVIFSARHVLYPHYVGAGLADQQTAGEIMWVGGSCAMFVAFMVVGASWAASEQRFQRTG